MMQSMVMQMTNPNKSPKMEPHALNFFCYLVTVSPQATELVGANLGSAPSKRWMQILNARERVACVYECQPSDMLKHMLNAVNNRGSGPFVPSIFFFWRETFLVLAGNSSPRPQKNRTDDAQFTHIM